MKGKLSQGFTIIQILFISFLALAQVELNKPPGAAMDREGKALPQANLYLARTYFLMAAQLPKGKSPNREEARGPESAEEHLNRGVVHLGRGRYDKAIEALRQAILLKPDLAAAHLNLGHAYFTLGRHQDAVESFEQVVRINPLEFNAYNSLGQAYTALRRHRERIQAFKQAIRIRPDFAEAHYHLGNAYADIGPVEEAVESYKQAVKADPAFAAAHINLGMTYRRLGRDEDAVGSLKEAIRYNPNEPRVYSMLANLLYNLSRYQEAVEYFTQLSRLDLPGEGLYRSRGFANLYLASGDAAAEDGRACLNLIGWRAEASQFMALLAHFGYRQSQRSADAVKILDEAATQCDTSKWPYPVIQYLRREIKSQDLLAKTINNDEMTEAHGYIGLDLSLSGHPTEALDHFRWVKEYGNRNFVEYHMALAEISRIEGPSGKSRPAAR